jgi:hypothetical protein
MCYNFGQKKKLKHRIFFQTMNFLSFNYFRILTLRGSNLVYIGKNNYESLVKSLPLRISTNDLFLGLSLAILQKKNL